MLMTAEEIDTSVSTRMVDSRRTMTWREPFEFETGSNEDTVFVRMYEFAVNK